jgi:uncharacterized membrane protein
MFDIKPKIEIEPNETDCKIIRIGWLFVVINFLIVGIFYFGLPDEIPTHFNLKGDADGFGPKNTIWALPILTAIMYYGMTLVVTKIKPWKMNYPIMVTEKNAPRLYKMNLRMLVILNLAISMVLFPISLEIIFAGHYINSGLSPIIATTIIVIFITLLPFYYIFKMYNLPKS